MSTAMRPPQIRLCRVDYTNPLHARALVDVLDDYARDPMGGSTPLSAFARANLPHALAARPQAFSVLAFDDAQDSELAVGLVNCLEGFSTFACRPLVNVHDVSVRQAYRGLGVAQQMLTLAEQIARERGACKLTLEVLQGNTGAIRLYEKLGFANYQLADATGHAQFLQKLLD
jgi:ribosomal protein S18 acetylase RimI-like enzyme